MPLYLVSYEIAQRNPEDYQSLWDLLKSRDAQGVLYSQWVVLQSGWEPEKRLYEAILPLLHDGDGLLITEVTRNTHWSTLRLRDADVDALVKQARNV